MPKERLFSKKVQVLSIVYIIQRGQVTITIIEIGPNVAYMNQPFRYLDLIIKIYTLYTHLREEKKKNNYLNNSSLIKRKKEKERKIK